MNTPVPIDKRTKEPVTPVQRRRVNKKTRDALRLRIQKGYTWAECAERVGLAQSSLFKAIRQPHVKALMLQMKEQYIQDVEEMENLHKARALEVARELLDESKSDSVKARMVEFLRGERAKNSVNVALQVNNQVVHGYEYVRPGQTLVEIQSPEDSQSPADDTENP